MARVFAVYTSDPNLMRCELRRLGDQVGQTAGDPANAVGMGSYSCRTRCSCSGTRTRPSLPPLASVWAGPESDAFLYHSQRLPLGLSLEENTQPFRFRSWLFAHTGHVEAFDRLRTRLLSSLPEFLQRQIRGDTPSEAAFALFLKHLRDTGRTDDVQLPAPLAAQAAGQDRLRALEQLSAEAGATGKSTLNFVATNGRLLIATRYGPEPLYYALYEGLEHCERCGKQADGRWLDHRMHRTVAISSSITRPTGWIELPQAVALSVDARLAMQTLPL